MRQLNWLLTLTILLAGCAPAASDSLSITLVMDDSEQVITTAPEATVADVLRTAGVDPQPLDRVNPPGFTRVSPGMVITVVRVTEETLVVEQTVPFRQLTQPTDGIPQGETRLLQPGVNGTAQITYRVLYEDGQEVSRTEIRRIELTAPEDEIVLVGSGVELATVTIDGLLVYIAGGDVWRISQNSASRSPVTEGGGADGRIFDLAAGGRLLFSRSPQIDAGEAAPGEEEPEAEEDSPSLAATSTPGETATAQNPPFNRLWAHFDVNDPEAEAVPLDLENVLYAQWVPGRTRTIYYSTAEPRPDFPGWQANNDLWLGQIDAEGAVINRVLLLEPSSGGLYGWYGTRFLVSPAGDSLAWAQPDAVGTLNPVYAQASEEDEEEAAEEITLLEDYELEAVPLPEAFTREPLASFAPVNPFDFVWLPGLSYAPGGDVLLASLHGPPLGSEAAEDSPLFDLEAFLLSGGVQVTLAQRSGMWAEPQFSPDGTRIAYLQAIEPLNSALSRYQLILVDRDGSNERALYPQAGAPGLRSQTVTWSPDGTQIMFVEGGNLFVIDTASGLARQVTADGVGSQPRWMAAP